MYLVFTCMPGENHRRRLTSLLLYLCYIFQALINSLVCWFCTSALDLVRFQICFSFAIKVRSSDLRDEIFWVPLSLFFFPSIYSFFLLFSLWYICACIDCHWIKVVDIAGGGLPLLYGLGHLFITYLKNKQTVNSYSFGCSWNLVLNVNRISLATETFFFFKGKGFSCFLFGNTQKTILVVSFLGIPKKQSVKN